jgi:nucleoid-associated protein YgaU
MTATATSTATVTAIRPKVSSPRPSSRRSAAGRPRVSGPATARPATARPATARPATARRPAPEVYRRRRLAAVALAIVFASVLVLLAGRVGHADAELDGPPPTPAVYVVQPGDTLWAIADQVAPDVDRRDVVAQLSDAAGGSDLVPGQRIELPRYFD